MGPQKTQDSLDINLTKLKNKVEKQSKLITKLQSSQKLTSKSLKELQKAVKLLTKTVQNNKETLENLMIEPEQPCTEPQLGLTEMHGNRTKIDRSTFLTALQQLLRDLKKSDTKEFIEIKNAKRDFLERYYLETDTDFDQWLLESYWSNEIELISGISDYSVRDIYDNVYHHIKY